MANNVKKERVMAKVMSNKKQLRKLVELLAANPSIALGVCSKSASQKVFKLFTPELNKLGPPIREWSTWMRVWADLKCKIKKKRSLKRPCPPGKKFHPKIHYNEMETAVIKLLEYDQNKQNFIVLAPPENEDSNMHMSSSDDDDDVDIIPTEEDMMQNISFEPLTNLMADDSQVVKNEPLSPKCDHDYSASENPSTSKSQPLSSRHLQDEKREEEYHYLTKNLMSLKECYQTTLTEHIPVEELFYKNMLDCVTDIRRSMDNIEDYMKMSVDKNMEILEVKRENLKAFAKAMLEEKSDRQAEIQLQSQLLAIQKQKLNDLKNV